MSQEFTLCSVALPTNDMHVYAKCGNSGDVFPCYYSNETKRFCIDGESIIFGMRDETVPDAWKEMNLHKPKSVL